MNVNESIIAFLFCTLSLSLFLPCLSLPFSLHLSPSLSLSLSLCLSPYFFSHCLSGGICSPVVARWTGLVNRSNDRSCIMDMIHNNINLISSGCPVWYNLAVQNRGYKIPFISHWLSLSFFLFVCLMWPCPYSPFPYVCIYIWLLLPFLIIREHKKYSIRK